MIATMTKERDAQRKAKERANERDLRIPGIADIERRRACEADDCLWLRTYCQDVFYNPFTPHQERIISDGAEALRYGTQKCKAAPRGDGKTSIIKLLALKYSLTRQVGFPLFVAATSKKAKDALESIKRRLASGVRIDQNKTCLPVSVLGQDYPLECSAAAYVDPWPSRARNVSANGGRPINVEWGAENIILPTWEDDEPLGPIMLALGITSDSLQGCNIYDRRPDFVMLDDLDSRDSLAAEDGVIAEKIEEAIDKTIAGLAGQSRSLGKFMLCTITSRNSAAAKYCDPKVKAWSGEKVAAIQVWPDRADLWKEYVELRQYGKATFGEDGLPVDPFGRQAHQFYLDNREAMDAGALLANPYNFEGDELPDGSQKQVSALQRCYDYIADNNLDSFLTEHQNDPPEDRGVVESGINADLVQKQMSGVPRGVIPDGCTVLTHTCDVGKLKGFNWVVRAWRPDGTGFTIDYGTMDVIGARMGTEEGLDRALFKAVLLRMAEFKGRRYSTASGQQIPDDKTLSLFDSRWHSDAICAAVKECGLGVKAFKGIGSARGCEKGTFRDIHDDSSVRKKCGTSGAYYALTEFGAAKRKADCIWAVHADTDRWKEYEHSRWMTAPDKPGCMFLFGTPSRGGGRPDVDERTHIESQYAQHICAEVLAEVDHKGFLVRRWIQKSKANDYFDASYMGHVAAAILGIRLGGGGPPPVAKPKRTLAQAAGRA